MTNLINGAQVVPDKILVLKISNRSHASIVIILLEISILILADFRSEESKRILRTSCLACLDCTVQAGGLENAFELYQE